MTVVDGKKGMSQIQEPASLKACGVWLPTVLPGLNARLPILLKVGHVKKRGLYRIWKAQIGKVQQPLLTIPYAIKRVWLHSTTNLRAVYQLKATGLLHSVLRNQAECYVQLTVRLTPEKFSPSTPLSSQLKLVAYTNRAQTLKTRMSLISGLLSDLVAHSSSSSSQSSTSSSMSL